MSNDGENQGTHMRKFNSKYNKSIYAHISGPEMRSQWRNESK